MFFFIISLFMAKPSRAANWPLPLGQSGRTVELFLLSARLAACRMYLDGDCNERFGPIGCLGH